MNSSKINVKWAKAIKWQAMRIKSYKIERRLSETARPIGEKDEPGKFLQRQRLAGDSAVGPLCKGKIWVGHVQK